VDLSEQLAIQECGRCHRSEREHQGGDPETLAVLEALGGACTHFAVSQAALAKVKRQARAPRVAPICSRCGAKGHEKPNCPW
jgi:hypothetical protein